MRFSLRPTRADAEASLAATTASPGPSLDERTIVAPPAVEGTGVLFRPLLGKILVETQRLTDAQLDDALTLQNDTGIRLGAALLQLGYTTEEDIAWGLAQQNEMPFYDLKEPPTPPLLLQIPARLARQLGVVPVAQDRQGRLVLVARNPLDFNIDGHLRAVLGRPIVIAWGVDSQIERILEAYTELSQW